MVQIKQQPCSCATMTILYSYLITSQSKEGQLPYLLHTLTLSTQLSYHKLHNLTHGGSCSRTQSVLNIKCVLSYESHDFHFQSRILPLLLSMYIPNSLQPAHEHDTIIKHQGVLLTNLFLP